MEGCQVTVNKTEVQALLERVFKTRLRHVEGTSHEFIIAVPELRGTTDCPFGECGVPVSGGRQVKGFYLRRAYEIAILLELYPPVLKPEDLEEDEKEDHEQDNYEGSLE